MEGRPFEALALLPGVESCVRIVKALVEAAHEHLSETETEMQNLRDQIDSVRDFELMEIYEEFAVSPRELQCEELRRRYRRLRRATRRPKGLDPKSLNEHFVMFKKEVNELSEKLVEDTRARNRAEKSIEELTRAHEELIRFLNAEQKKDLTPAQDEVIHQAGLAVIEPVHRLVHEFEHSCHANWKDIDNRAVRLTRLVKGTRIDVPEKLAAAAYR